MIKQQPIYPSDNEWDIPTLLPDLQGVPITPPICCWGSVARTAHMPGTWVLYARDDRFSVALRNPEQLHATGCACAVEANVSIYDGTPMAVAIHAIYQKRWASRAWQELGIRILVDLNVPERYLRWNLTGVPRGWRAYATRGYRDRPESLRREWSVMREWSEGLGTLLVYGGGRATHEVCRELPGAIWSPDHMAEYRAKRYGCAPTGRVSALHCNSTVSGDIRRNDESDVAGGDP